MTQDTLPASEDARPRGRWLTVARVAWVAVALAELVLFAASVPAYWDQLNTVCADPSGATCNFPQLNPVKLQALERLGATIDVYAAYTLAIHAGASLVFFVVGALIFWRKSGDWYGLFVSLFLIAFGTIGPSGVFADALSQAYPGMMPLLDALSWLLFPVLGLFLVTFPDGRFVPRWSWVVVFLWVIQAALWGVIDSWPPPLFVAELLLVYGSTLAVQIYRYRRVATPTQRHQTKWVLFGFALGVSTIVISGLLTVVFPQFNEPGSRFWLLEGTWVALLFTPLPLSIGVALLRYRLWDIDPIINRTLVYGALTAIVAAIYVLVVGYLGALFRTSGNLAISLLTAGLVAVLFAPLRNRLQRGINRLMYGERDEPYKVLSLLGERLEAMPATPNAALSTVVETVAGALKLPYAAITVPRDGRFITAAEHGVLRGDPITLPLSHGGEPMGRLVLAPRSPGEAFYARDEGLLEDLARQAGAAVHAMRLTADLQRSRERLVSTREEERRRLRRDLHDGLGPRLAAQTLKAGSARMLYARDPAAADALLSELEADMESAISEVRRLVYDLRPPALDELGLAGAIRETAAQYETTGLKIFVEAPEELPPLPAAVEVAAYRVASEAITNVVRHAGAGNCVVRLSLRDGLELEVSDDGSGLPAGLPAGVGLLSMRERAEELGGECRIGPSPTGGARVIARLPLPDGDTPDDTGAKEA